MKKSPVDIWIISPVRKFINRQSASGLVLFVATALALILSNSPIADWYHSLWKQEFTIGLNEYLINQSLHHWINDGLMAVFFFVIGLELKREIIAGELSKPRDAILPLAAGFGGMILPATLYLLFNPEGEAVRGWGIPMATDIAFALGILYLLGKRVPISLKVFLTALAIADDLGAVMVIAIFYTSDISFISLAVGALFMVVLVGANLLGVRSTIFYGTVGIAGLWLAFLMSGVHATVAAVLAAFTIPARVMVGDALFLRKVRMLADEFEHAQANEFSPIMRNVALVSKQHLYVLDKFRYLTKAALTPLQRLEHAMHPFVAFVVLPVFALANAGVTFSPSLLSQFGNPVTLGIIAGLVVGKFFGIVAITRLMVWTRLARLPHGVKWPHIYAISLLAGVGFTMSLFITELAFTDPEVIEYAKMGILSASFIAGVAGYFVLKWACREHVSRPELPDDELDVKPTRTVFRH